MAAYQADLPDKYILGDSWGLGWIRFGWDGHRLIGHDGNTIGQAAFLRHAARGRASRSRCSPTAATPATSTRTCTAEIFAELAGVAMPRPARAARRAGRRRHRRRTSAGTSARASPMEVCSTRPARAAHDGHRPDRRARAPRAGRRVPDRPGGRGRCSWSASPRTRDLDTRSTFYSLPTGEEYVHFGARATPEGGLMPRDRAARRDAGRHRGRRVRVALVRPRRGGALAPTSWPDRGRPARRRAGTDRRRRPHPPALALRRRRRPGCWCSATTTPCGRSERWPTTRSVDGRGAARARAAST